MFWTKAGMARSNTLTWSTTQWLEDPEDLLSLFSRWHLSSLSDSLHKVVLTWNQLLPNTAQETSGLEAASAQEAHVIKDKRVKSFTLLIFNQCWCLNQILRIIRRWKVEKIAESDNQIMLSGSDTMIVSALARKRRADRARSTWASCPPTSSPTMKWLLTLLRYFFFNFLIGRSVLFATLCSLVRWWRWSGLLTRWEAMLPRTSASSPLRERSLPGSWSRRVSPSSRATKLLWAGWVDFQQMGVKIHVFSQGDPQRCESWRLYGTRQR